MSGSVDSLRKKVCVTVFLDELFEEVLDENWKDRKVGGLPESQVKTNIKKSSLIELNKDEKNNVTTSARAQHQVLRPRKHRRQSKFSKNHSSAFKSELNKYDYESSNKTGNECPQSFESSVTESDFDFNEILDINKPQANNKPNSLSEVSKVDVAEKNLITSKSVFSSKSILCTDNERNLPTVSELASKSSKAMFCEKSTQFDCPAKDVKKLDEEVDDEVTNDKEDQDAKENVLAWKKIQREIYLLLAKAKSRQLEKEAKSQTQNMTCNSKECANTEKSTLMKELLGKVENLNPKLSKDSKKSDASLKSHSSMFLPDKLIPTSGSEVKELWSATERNSRNDEFQSDTSEIHCVTSGKEMALKSFQQDSLLFYTLCVKSKRDFQENETNKDECTVENDNDEMIKIEETGEEDDDDDDEDDEDENDIDGDSNEDDDGDEDEDDEEDDEDDEDDEEDDDEDDDEEEEDDDEDDDDNDEDDDTEENLNTVKLVFNSEFVSRESSSEGTNYKMVQKSGDSQTTKLPHKKISDSSLKLEGKSGNKERVFIKKSETVQKAENRNKNFAEGDTFEKSFHQDLNFILNIQEKEKQKLLVYDGILKHVPQSKVLCNEIIVNRAEIGLLGDARGEVPKKHNPNNSSRQSFKPSESFAQVYIKKRKYRNCEDILTDVESEMPFADSEGLDSSVEEDGLNENICHEIKKSGSKLCVRLENELSHLKITREKKPSEILRPKSLSEVKNVSAEVVFIFSDNIRENHTFYS